MVESWRKWGCAGFASWRKCGLVSRQKHVCLSHGASGVELVGRNMCVCTNVHVGLSWQAEACVYEPMCKWG